MTRYLPPVIVFLVALAVFAPAIDFGWIDEWDDRWVILENQYLGEPTLQHLAWSLDPNKPLYDWGAEYLPVRNISYFIDRWLWDYEPAGWHAHNVLLHALASAAVWLLLTRLGLTTGPATAGALLFAVHGLHVEPVAWVMGRRTCLAVLFLTLAGLAWLPRDRPRRLTDGLLAALAIALAALSKPNALAAPALLIALDLARARPADDRPDKRHLLSYAPVLCTVAALTALHLWVGEHRTGQTTTPAYANPGPVAAALFARYTGTALIPFPLCIPYPWSPWRPPASSWTEPLVLAGLATLATLGALAVLALSSRRQPPQGRPAPLLVACLWWPAALLPALQLLLPIPRAYAERYAGTATLALAFAGASLYAALDRKSKGVARLLFGLLIALQLGATLYRLPDWRDSGTLWRAAVRNRPDNPMAHYKLGRHLQSTRSGDPTPHYERAIELAPDMPGPITALGEMIERRHPARALRLYERAVNCPEPHPRALYLRARIALQREARDPHTFRRARDWLQRSLELDPTNDRARRLLAQVEAGLRRHVPRGQ